MRILVACVQRALDIFASEIFGIIFLTEAKSAGYDYRNMFNSGRAKKVLELSANQSAAWHYVQDRTGS